MNTNDSQFLKAYNDLVTAFFNFMNVVQPQGAGQANVSYVASQLNQLLNYLAQTPQGSQQMPPQMPQQADRQPNPAIDTAPAESPQQPAPQPIIVDPVAPKPASNAIKPKERYCAYPEFVNGHYKFKSSMISKEKNDDSVYELYLDEDAQEGFVVLRDLSGDLLKTVANNQSLYLPLEICPNVALVTSDKESVSSKSKLRLVKVVRGWEIVDGDKFTLEVK